MLFKTFLTLLIISLYQSVSTMNYTLKLTAEKTHCNKMFANVCDVILIFPHIIAVTDLGEGPGGGGGAGSPTFLGEKGGKERRKKIQEGK